MRRFFDEIKRRKVTRVAIAYLVAAWLLLQVADNLTSTLELPLWAPKLVFLLLALGFIPALILAWAYELTPDGIKRETIEPRHSGSPTSTGRYVEHTILGLLTLSIIGAAIFWYLGSDERWAREEALPQIDTHIDAGEFEAAFALAREVEKVLADDPELLERWVRFTTITSIPSEPPGATVYRRGYAETDAPWELLGTTPLHDVRLPVGFSLLKIELAGHRPLLRVVGNGFLIAERMPVGDRPQNTSVEIRPERFELDKDEKLPEDMVRVPGHDVVLDGELARLDDFFISRHEVSNREFKKFVDEGGYRRQDLWEHEIQLEGKPVSWETAMNQFTDESGRPGPSTWEAGNYPDGEEDFPVTGISWYEAAAYARFATKKLPSVHHWRRAMALGTLTWLLPASNLDNDGVAPIGIHRGIGWTGTFDMAGNAREWCFNAIGDQRAILGGAFNDQFYVVQESVADLSRVPPDDRSDTNGFRLIREIGEQSAANQLYAALAEPVVPEIPDPVSDDVFKAYGSYYEYDKTPFNAKSLETNDEHFWTRETVSIDAGYDNEKMTLYLYLPKTGTPPFQTIVFWPEHPAMVLDKIDSARVHLDFALKNGRAIAIPMLEGTYARRVLPVPEWDTVTGRNLSIQQVKDFRRTIDYLETRRDVIDSSSLAYYGISWGGRMGAIVLAVEPRLKVGILNQAGINPYVHPDIHAVHYLSRVTVPVLQFNGEYDADFRLNESALPFFNMLRTPDADKEHVVEPTGHFVPQPVYIGHTLDWLDRYLGPAH